MDGGLTNESGPGKTLQNGAFPPSIRDLAHPPMGTKYAHLEELEPIDGVHETSRRCLAVGVRQRALWVEGLVASEAMDHDNGALAVRLDPAHERKQCEAVWGSIRWSGEVWGLRLRGSSEYEQSAVGNNWSR